MIGQRWKRVMHLCAGMMVALCLFTSCEKDTEGGYFSKPFRLELGTLTVSDSAIFIKTDNGDVLPFSSFQTLQYPQETGRRVFVNYSETDSGVFTVRSISQILQGAVSSVDTIGVSNASVLARSIWSGGGFLNFSLRFYRLNKLHRFALIPDASVPYRLRLWHFSDGDEEGYPVDIYLSFSTDSVPGAAGFSFWEVEVPSSDGQYAIYRVER